ncbi:hypothetical protein N7466_000618 [Penicillium verhagenii]|uniref:uncharacterized protein n=1 Tax=Penicillium verhagenii TaxID=1562060 RepID=UPI002545AEE3|nr:uncharacterized protein N7466_000618 [Penicillium verhagenii]KAJ5947603.1 hypothetical protein N7466_000618 [Penicillium verhagenii]
MTERTQFQQPFNQDSGAGPPSHYVETNRSIDPRTSLEDYNRTMLHYTQLQMSSFVDLDVPGGARGSGTSSRSSQSSGNSGNSNTSSNGVLANQANGPPPTSAGSSTDGCDKYQQARMKPSANRATSGY